MKRHPRAAALLCALALTAPARLHADFLRGDANQDLSVDVSDGVTLIRHLFGPGFTLTCMDAADANDDGVVDFADIVVTLHGIFLETPIPNPGSLLAGPDPTCDQLGCDAAPDPTPALVLSEIMYHPNGRETWEYVEIYNRSNGPVDAGGHVLTGGVQFEIPAETIVPAQGFLLVLKEPSSSKWRRIAVPKVGPYSGYLSDVGDRVTLVGECGSESVRYSDDGPWPLGADGYGPSLERVDYQAPCADFHSWRTSTAREGTPGVANASLGVPTYPMITFSATEPDQPSSSDVVTVTIVLDAAPDALRGVTLHWEVVAEGPLVPGQTEMTVTASGDSWAQLEATVPPSPSQAVVRINLALERDDGTTLVLPHPADPNGFLSYFVYDFEMQSKFPIFWLFRSKTSTLPGREVLTSGAAILDPGDERVQVFDGAVVKNRSLTTGLELQIPKNQSYRGLRTFDIIPEAGGGGTGTLAPHMEHMGHKVFRDMGALAPEADWCRVIERLGNMTIHDQRLVISEVNERFLERLGLRPGGDLYKIDHKLGFLSKKTNLLTGSTPYFEMRRAITTGPVETRLAEIHDRLDVDNICLYSVVGALIANWDGFHNNMYTYLDFTSETARWRVFPWDLDQVFQPELWQFDINYPRTGLNPTSPGVNRNGDARPFSQPFHEQPVLNQLYLDRLRAATAPDGPFTVERINGQIDAIEALLLEDLALQETYLGQERPSRRAAIVGAYAAMRSYVSQRVPYLRSLLQ